MQAARMPPIFKYGEIDFGLLLKMFVNYSTLVENKPEFDYSMLDVKSFSIVENLNLSTTQTATNLNPKSPILFKKSNKLENRIKLKTNETKNELQQVY